MKVTTILGSPNKKGKTSAVLALAEEKLIAQGHEIDRIDVTNYQINGCLGCYSCMRNSDAAGCVQKDDADKVLNRITAADAVIYASPLYCFDLTAQMKPLIDRTFCLTNTALLNGKWVAALITCAGPEEDNADLVKEFFRRSFDGEHGGLFKTKLAGEFIVPFSNSTDFMERAENTANILSKAIISDEF